MDFLKEKRVCSSSRASHEECYSAFAVYLADCRNDYSHKITSDWIASIKEVYSWQKCYYWNQYMIQLEEMVSTGTISDRYLYQIWTSYDKLPDSLKTPLDDYLKSCVDSYTRRSWELAKIYCSKVMLFFHDHGVETVSAFTYQHSFIMRIYPVYQRRNL